MAGDEVSHKDTSVDTREWSLIHSHTPWKKNKQFQRYAGNAWYRMIIVIDDVSSGYGILVPVHYRGAEFYLNGNKFYASREFDDRGHSPKIVGKSELIVIQDDLVRKGENVLAIRTGGMSTTGGFNGIIKFGLYRDLHDKWIHSFIYNTALLSINFFLALFFLIIFLYRRKDTYYLTFSVLSFLVSLFILGYKGIILWILDYQLAYIIALYLSALMFPYIIISLLYGFFTEREGLAPKVLLFLLVSFSVALIVEYLSTGELVFFHRYLYNPFMLFSLIAVFYSIILCIKKVRERKPYASYMLAGISVLAISMFISMFEFLDVIKISPPVLEGYFLMTIVFSSALASRFARVHTELEKAHDDLLVIDKMKDEFLATTSHELRTPLHAISGLAETMEMSPDEPPTERQKESLAIMRRSALRLSRLVDDILDFNKLRAGRVDLFVEEVDLAGLLRGMASLAGALVGDRPIQVRAEVSDGLPKIIGDRHRIEQIVLNLMANSIKFTAEGEVTLTAHTEGEGVNIAVRDTGCGIDTDDLAGIWSPYRQVEPADTRRHGGVGLGLAITRQLVDMHGGRISAVSEAGKGSLFTVWLPPCPPEGIATMHRAPDEPVCLPPPPRADDEAPGEPGAVSFPRRVDDSSEVRVLVVDDDQANLRILVEVLSRQGYKVRTVASGSEAVAAVEASIPHIVLLDIMLPGMSGYEVAARIRATYSDIYIPIIMVTARSGMEDMVKGFAFGGNDYIVKPFNSREVLARVENQLAISNMISMEKRVESFMRRSAGPEETSLVARAAALDEAVRRLSDWEAIISKDLGVAKGFLARLMRRTVQTDSVEYDIDYDPLFAIGGDVYDVHEFTPGKIRVFLGDATGHGIHASLNTITIMTEYGQLRGELASPSEMLTALNDRFCSRFSHYRIVFTCCVAEIDLFAGTVRFASAGHPTQFATSDGQGVARLKPAGPIIGFRKGVQYNELLMDFKPGAVLFLYTDGLLDEGFRMSTATGDGRVMRGEEYLRGVLENLPGAFSPAEICAAVKKEMKGERRKKDRLTDDDITVIALRRK